MSGTAFLEVLIRDSEHAAAYRLAHGYADGSLVGALLESAKARAAVKELIEADGEYDSALAAFNNTPATHPDWPFFNARFESAKTRRANAFNAFRGQL